MGIEIRLPQFTGATEREQLTQVKSYLFQLAQQLQWALQNVDTTNNATVITPTPKSLVSSRAQSEVDAYATFNSIKSLIIKSADIVQAYYEEINRKLEGAYVAQSDFGAFAEKTTQEIEETSKSTTQRFENVQVIITGLSSDLGTIEGDLQTIGEDLSYAQRDIINLNGSIDTLGGNIASVEGAVGELDSSLESAKTELSGDINSAKTELEGMVEEVDEDLQTAKTTTNERIDDTNGSVANLGSGLNDANTRIADVDEDLQDSKEALNNSIQGVQESVTGVNALLEDAKAQLNGSLEDLEAYVTDLKQVVIGVTAYLKSGLLYYTDAGIPVYGLEIGQSVRDEVAGTEVFNKYARFTSEKLSFYDSNGTEVAYISDKKLYIKMAHITVSLQLGGLLSLVMPNGDVVEKWVGIGG